MILSPAGKMAQTVTGPGGFGGFDPHDPKKKLSRAESQFHASELKRYKSREKDLAKEIAALRKQVEADALTRKRCRLLEDESRILKNQVVSLQEDQVGAYDSMQQMYDR